MKIGARQVDGDSAPYVIAELGVNHDGRVECALELTRSAAAAGADAIKLQLFETDRLMSRAAKLAAYQKAAGETDPVAMLRRLELSIDDMARVVKLAHELGVDAIVTVFSVELVEIAEQLPWDAYKTASPDLVHRPLLEALAATGKPMIVSTGAADMEEVERAVKWIGGMCRELALLQCVSCYPTAPADANIAAMISLKRVCATVGYSDHTREVDTGAIAASLGAVILEKHFTYDTRAEGPDHRASLDAAGFAEYVKRCRGNAGERRSPVDAVRAGSEHKRVLACERDVREVSRQSIVTRRAMCAGEVVGRGDVTFKRPGTGLAPHELDAVIGRRLRVGVEGDVPLERGQIE